MKKAAILVLATMLGFGSAVTVSHAARPVHIGGMVS